MSSEAEDDTDGYYFRDGCGRLRGPLTRFQYEAWSLRGAIAPGSKVWRQRGANHYPIRITRRVRWRKLASARGCGAVMEWATMAGSFLMLVFLLTLKPLRVELAEELSGHAATAVFFGALLVATVVLTAASLRKVSGRVAATVSEVHESEA